MHTRVRGGDSTSLLLRQLIGQWRGFESLLPIPGQPHTEARQGVVTYRPCLDGLALTVDYQQSARAAVVGRGTGILEIGNPDFQAPTVLHWWETDRPFHARFTGAWAGSVLTLTRDDAPACRLTYRFELPHRYEFTLERSIAPGSDQVCKRATYEFHSR